MGTVGVQEMIVIFLVALVLFGPKKLPELGRTIGKAITEFRRASSDLKASFEREMHNLEREAELEKTKAEVQSALPSGSDYEYTYNDGEYSNGSSPTVTNSTTVSASEVSSAESNGSAAAEAAPEQVVEVTGEAAGDVPTEPAEPVAATAATPVEGTVPHTESTTQHS